jgi:peptidyl-prolyl cis-trans isomerase C
MKCYQLFYIKGWLWLVVFAIFLAGCNRSTPSPAPSPAQSMTSVEEQTLPPSPSPREETPTPQPLAARVNSAGITLAEYQAELARYQQAAGKELTDADRQRVLDDLINQELLAQASAENGFILDEAALQERLNKLTSQLGSAQALADWMSANGYDEAEFRQQLARSVQATWMRDQILAKLPATAEQVHARQLLFRTAEEANQALAKLQAGADFEALAREADPITNGELGWFPRGFLFFPELEEAAFKLEAEQYSSVIQTPSGFHILYVVERDPQHNLDPQAREILQGKALQAWLDERRQQSQIEIIAP